MTHILAILTAAYRRTFGAPRGRVGMRSQRRHGHARAALLVCLALGAFAAVATPALSAAETSTTTAEESAQRAAAVLAERQARLAVRRAEAARRRQQIREERATALAQKRANGGGTSANTRPNGYVEISCTAVTWHFLGFKPSGTRTVVQFVSIDGSRTQVTPYTFSGASGEDTTPINPTASRHRIDAFARWNDGGTRGNWDIPSVRTCGTGGSGPSYTIEKRQKIAGIGKGYVTEPLTGEVGQTIEYEIVVTNTGGVYLTFTSFTDPRCDPGTVQGGFEGPIAPGGSVTVKCTHAITTTDQENKTYENTAMVTGTPTLGGESVTTPTNTVVVTVPPVSQNNTPTPPQNPPTNTNTTTTTTGSTGSQGVLGTSGSQAPGSGGQGSLATSASVPSISGVPRGCTRSNFVIRVRAKGVRSAVFYIDGHRVRTLTARNARAGLLTLHVNVKKLKLGVHRIKVRITMTPLTASTKPVVVTRTVKFAHCTAGTIVGPRFAG